MEKDSDILIIGQHLTSRTEAIRDFLLPRVKSITVIALGSAFVSKKENHLFFYEEGLLKQHRCFKHPLLKKLKRYELLVPATFFFYGLDIVTALLNQRKRFDVSIGVAHFCGLIGISLKKMWISKKNIYYAIDYYAPLAKGSVLKNFFIEVENLTDRLAVKNSDEVWDISPRISEARLRFGAFSRYCYESKHKVVPLGYPDRFFRHKDISQIDRFSIVFVGVIVEGQGLELLLESLSELKNCFPDIKVRVIGTGPYLSRFKEMVDGDGFDENFIFYSFVENEDEMLDLVSSSAIGISLWDDRENKFLNSYLGDPGKTKLYSTCGLPVIVSNNTVYADIVTKNRCGIAIHYKREELLDAIKTLFLNNEKYSEYKSNTIEAALEYCSSEKIFSQVI